MNEEVEIKRLQKMQSHLQSKINILSYKIELLMKKELKLRGPKIVKINDKCKVLRAEVELGSDLIRRFYFNPDFGIVKELKDEIPKIKSYEVYSVVVTFSNTSELVVTKLIKIDEKWFEKMVSK